MKNNKEKKELPMVYQILIPIILVIMIFIFPQFFIGLALSILYFLFK